MRADLPRGVQAANLIHAAGESSPGNLPQGTHAYALVAAGETELRALEARLTDAQIPFVAIYEPDPPYDNALMAIGCLPGRKEVLRRALSALPLLR